MGWFARYGIPGTYFLLDSLLWIFLVVPKARLYVLSLDSENPAISALLALSALPFGYILTIIQQYYYLHKKKTGIYRRALEDYRQKVDKSLSEVKIEAAVFCKLHFSDEDRYGPRDWAGNINFVRTWIERRVDILVINGTLRWATVLAIGPVIVFWISFKNFNIIAAIILSALSALLYWILRLSTKTLESQLVYVLSHFYQNNKITYP